MDKQESAQPQGAADLAALIKDRLAPVDQWVRKLAREQPLLLVAGAVGLGYLVGRLVRRG